MNFRNPSKSKDSRNEMMRQANRLASKGLTEEAFDLFRASIRSYWDDDLPMRALAVAKAARSALGITPRLQVLQVRLYNSVGLCGEADKEIQNTLKYLGLDKISFFQKLNLEHTLNFLDAMEVWHIDKMEQVFQQSTRYPDIFIIQHGTFEMHRDQQRLWVMKPGEIFGEIGFLYPSNRSAMVRAMEKSCLIRLKSPFIQQMCDRYPDVRRALKTLYTDRLKNKPGETIQIGIDYGAELAGATIPNGSLFTALDGIMIVKLTDDLEQITEVTVPKGMAIPAFDGMTILKYGMVEVDYNDQELSKKKFIRPGMELQFSGEYAGVASTNVRLIQAKNKI